MANMQVHRFKTISEFHQFRGYPGPENPLISVLNLQEIKRLPANEVSFVKDFYSIALKRNFNVKMKYGQQDLDYNDGVMFFMAPGQLLRLEVETDTELRHSGWMLLVHPDFLWNTPLAKTIRQYEYFDYAVNEALFLSEREETTISGIMQSIQQEYQANIDKYSQDLMIAQLELLLKYSERFYQRQFITRKIANHKVLDRLESVISEYLNSDDLMKTGLPTVQYVANALNISPNYLGGMLKTLTGLTTQQHIHEKLIERAKERLSVTDLSVSEIAYELGFEHPQSFSKLFKTKTHLSPLEFRQSFN
ncbi:AraC family transcriptional regulator [Dyadobacter sp. CY323]|uniref:helix-turn-helix domain-containing protein n=1 Tax=Dyadobacter sp. CY323 TaxID=2907302 RepID=UPI001F16C425|nr:helix-turn-helix domain-containing protein [Dyadobacter sp. CY323]MCE6991889.1 helix-turn-helix domain-containing protein [Dyadobacter sp. CY323]